MCGIAGVFGGSRVDAETVTRMTRAIAYRGPDDEGVWIDADAGIGLGHRRLSIIDLSPAGHQPMSSPTGRYVITYNGEIYNYADLRAELEAAGQRVAWRGHSDTEILLAGFDHWGIEATLKKAFGMFAFAVWDKSSRTLTLARDRLGEKPLYYGRQRPAGPFLFASELKAMQQHPDFVADVDREALALFVRYLDVPAPLSIYRGIAKLMPGTMLTIGQNGEAATTAYWSGASVAVTGSQRPSGVDPAAATDALEAVLEKAVARQMVSDVPLGAFLSGGVDSSSVVAIMQKLSPRPVKTFTIGFHEEGFNEAEHAKAVAKHLGTDHTELYVTPKQAMDVIPSLPEMYDEPFADSSQIPTHLISALARQQVTVALSGDGGDELFGGYDRYLLTQGFWSKVSGLPSPMRAMLARGLKTVPVPAWTAVGNAAGNLMPQSLRLQRLGDKVHKGASMLASQSFDELYDHMLSMWRADEAVVIGASRLPIASAAGDLNGLGGVERMMALDMLGYLTDDILVKVDRAAMAVSLETRVPLLDPEVVEFAWRLPLPLRIREGKTKWLLRQLLYRHVPPELIERPKMGFGVPIEAWLRGPLRDWAEALLDEQRLREEGYFHAAIIRKAWDRLLRGPTNAHRLWTVLMFQSWLQHQKQRTASKVEPLAAAC